MAVEGNSDIGCSIVGVAWDKGSTIWDYDQKVFDTVLSCLRYAWPIRCAAIHVCCPPICMVRFAFPVIRAAVMDKWLRSRFEIHDVPECEIVQVLAEYGIQSDMLPTHIGGKVQLNQLEWIANRRAIEMEEI